ncbi:MAG: helix-turn-helix domain-containing protein [Ardenticatenia bacterium]|uniref:Transposase n=1 Tax=Ardenticatena maritima TaxID=872965 RepID=A0A0M9UE08_9CHLR|nr:helix-turn-helix domain-containing protein [Ardenticatena maritima]KPL89594.1 hypothetical protein SE16_04030 [Ardenticatena maritima]RME13873.1 MAG: helix-turn-helix domain-containing protein [Ardenticatenia bacterium]GAP64540.1 hypothetical protein ARMA_2963 [Ardenticatena maritima]
MARRLELHLTPEQRRELEDIRDNHPLRYMRERAEALLKIAEGKSGREVALKHLPKERQPDTVYRWVHRYQKEGVKGLFIRPGRGRKPKKRKDA